MNRLQSELQRLYLPPGPGADGRVRAMMLGLAGPTGWDELSAVWQGVQADLQLPAPGIAVSGTDGWQLWFSLAQPVPAGDALAFLAGLRRRYLGGVAPERVAMLPAEPSRPGGSAPAVPPVQVAPGRWSAFIAPDLPALFVDEPWLDLEPTPEAQAELLSRLQPIPPAGFDRALASLGAGAAAAPAAAAAGAAAAPAPTPPAGAGQDAERFLLAVMNDPAVDLHLRIEAAKALLPHHLERRAR